MGRIPADLAETASNEWRFGSAWPKSMPTSLKSIGPRGCAPSTRQLDPFGSGLFNVPALNAN
jgi:hypothetical protein